MAGGGGGCGTHGNGSGAGGGGYRYFLIVMPSAAGPLSFTEGNTLIVVVGAGAGLMQITVNMNKMVVLLQ